MTLKVQNTLPHLENSERSEALLGLAPGWPSGFHVTACSHFSVCTAVRRFDVVFTPSTFIDVVYVPESAAKAPCGALSSWFRPCPGAGMGLPSGAAASTRSMGKAMSSTETALSGTLHGYTLFLILKITQLLGTSAWKADLKTPRFLSFTPHFLSFTSVCMTKVPRGPS